MKLLYLLFLLPPLLPAQDTLLVLDPVTNTPLPYATLSYPGGGAIADMDGRLTLHLTLPDTVDISYVNFVTQRRATSDLRDLGTLFLEPGYLYYGCGITVVAYLADLLPRRAEVIDRAEITRAQPLTSADALANLSGVYVQKSQLGGGSPVLRGFEANRVLLVVDGVRMNNAIFRSGHLHNGISVDAGSLERVTLLYGPTALEFGSDALGGVVSYETQSPELAATRTERGWTADASLGYSTAARASQLSAGIGWSGENWATLTRVSLADINDLRTGGWRPNDLPPGFGLRPDFVLRRGGRDTIVNNADPRRQAGSGYRQLNLLHKTALRTGERSDLGLNLQYSTTSDVPRYDALTERRGGGLRWSRWDYGPQTRTLAALTFNHRSPTPLFDRASHLVSYQFIGEDRLTRRFDDPLTEHSLVDVGSLNYQSRFQLDLGEHEVGYGVDGRIDRVRAEAFLRSVTGERSAEEIAPRYPGAGSSLLALGAYLRGRYRLSKELSLTGGLRYGYQNMRVKFSPGGPVEWPAAYYEGITNETTAVTAALGAQYAQYPHRLKLLFSQGFRAPNVDDFAKFRERNGQLQLPNPGLRPERVDNLEMGYEVTTGKFRGRATAYHSWLTDAIIRRAGTGPDGQRVLVSREETFRVRVNDNVERARIYGLTVGVSYPFRDDLTVSGDLNWQRGRRRQSAEDGRILIVPQDHIPPTYGRAALTYERGRVVARGQVDFQLAKPVDRYAVGQIEVGGAGNYFLNRAGTPDNLELTPVDPATGAFTGSRGWWTVGLYLTYALTDRWTMNVKGENLLDRFYRPFAAGISAAGRDFGVSVTLALSKNE